MPSVRATVFGVLWSAAAITAAVLYSSVHLDGNLIGVVEMVTHEVGTLDTGIVASLTVSVGDQVVSGQQLAMLDIRDIEASNRELREQQRVEEQLLTSDRERCRIEQIRHHLDIDREHDRLRSAALELDQLASEAAASVTTKTTEYVGLANWVARMVAANSAGLGRADELASLTLKRDTLRSALDDQRQTLAQLQIRAEHTHAALTRWEKDSAADGDEPPLLSGLARIAELQAQLATNEQRLRCRRLESPCAGRVIAVHARIGDNVRQSLPIVTIAESDGRWLDVYFPDSEGDPPRPGIRVKVEAFGRVNASAAGTVTATEPGYVPVPVELLPKPASILARKIRVRLDSPSQVLPGERVLVHLVPGAPVAAAQADAAPIVAQAGPIEMSAGLRESLVPPSLRERSAVEPSGLVWLADLERYLVVSDDTGLHGQHNHAPWLLLMDRKGAIDPDPLVVSGTAEFDDLESLSLGTDGTIYLVSSQSISKHGKRPVARQMIFEAHRKGREITVQRSFPLWKLIAETWSDDALKALGLTVAPARDQTPLNIEGSAFHDGDLYLGLKEPGTTGAAIIWKLAAINDLFTKQAITPAQLTLYATVDLARGDGAIAGISDLMFDSQGRLLLLSTIPSPHLKGRTQCGALSVVEHLVPGANQARCLMTFTGRKTEGIAEIAPGKFIIVIDQDAETPQWIEVEAPAK